MKRALYIGVLLLAACNSAQQNVATTQQPAPVADVSPDTYAKTITETELKEHLYTYASDEFKGRETATEGEKMATDYLVNAYKEMGVAAAQSNGDYLQAVPLVNHSLPSGTVQLGNKNLEIGKDIFTMSSLSNVILETVYAGYGIETDSYSDYEGLDVTGKAVIFKLGEPKAEDGTYLVSGDNQTSEWSNWRQSLEKRIKIATDKGAATVIYLDDAFSKRMKQRYDYLKQSEYSGQLGLAEKETSANLLFAGESILNGMDLKAGATAGNVTIKADGKDKEVIANNVVAMIKGKTKPEEYIVISAHLDHIGVSKDGEVNNGADDDGSGTVAVLEIAEAFKAAADAGNGPDRSIVFLHVTGEEKGLFGSEYYTNHPIFPLEQTVADLNIDMIGRIDPKREGNRNYIYLIGSDKLSTELHLISEEVNAKYMNIELDYTYNDENDPNRFYYRSDHYNFAKNNVPVIFYFNGTHDDYHRPSDTPDKINYDLLTNRAQLVFHTAWEVANRPQRIKVDKAATE
ncbi:M28 family peptidase [Robertkochia sediminum]|uniref:M28 family peptidase n=1 Tax=Robertkochia sediminum TaxID=2785326 RepID=UPI0019327374|nr:M28 family peptidase [Robertkochia sediminum]MBL7473214.1 M28 family peptidase [Robertkochia sediminum]